MNLAQAKLLDQADAAIKAASRASSTAKKITGYTEVDTTLFHEFRSLGMSFLLRTFGRDHPHFVEFSRLVSQNRPYDLQIGTGVLVAARVEIENGWLTTLRSLLAADTFGDFLEQAEHLIATSFKDPAAVLVGSVLERHLKDLAGTVPIDLHVIKPSGEQVPKKAELLNQELAKSAVYNLLDQQSVTSWLALRNKAAHGEYGAYTIEQVSVMLEGVRSFVSRNPA